MERPPSSPRIFKISGYIPGILCYLIALSMLVSILNDYRKSIPLPIPYDFAEGVTCWMARELSVLKSPYGDIEEIPSRYSAYGPLFPAIVGGLSHVIPNDKSPPVTGTLDSENLKTLTNLDNRFIIIGRSLNALFWLLTGFIIGLLTRKWQYALLICPIPCMVFSTLFPMWSWRIDSLVMLLEACILLLLAHQKTNHTLKWNWGLDQPNRFMLVLSAVTALMLTKPTAIIDLVPITILAYCLNRPNPQNVDPNDNWKAFFQTSILWLSISVFTGTVILLIINYLSSGWMLNNIFKIQPMSGWHNDGDFQSVIGTFMKNPTFIAFGIWTLLIPILTNSKKIVGIYLSLSLSLLLCGLTSLKFGAAINYFMPLLVVALAICCLGIKKYPGALFLLLIVGALSLPLKHSNLPFRQENWKLSLDEAETLSSIVNQHKSNQIVTEDAFFSVLAGHQPLISDIFQFLIINLIDNKNREVLQKSVKRTWSGWRVEHVLGQDQNKYSPEKPVVNTLRNITGTSIKGRPIIIISKVSVPVNNKEIGIMSLFYYIIIPCFLITLLGPITIYYKKVFQNY